MDSIQLSIMSIFYRTQLIIPNNMISSVCDTLLAV